MQIKQERVILVELFLSQAFLDNTRINALNRNEIRKDNNINVN